MNCARYSSDDDLPRFPGDRCAGLAGLLGVAACSATANVSEVWMSIDEDGGARRSVFFTDSANVTRVAEVGVGLADVTFELDPTDPEGTVRDGFDFEPVNEVVPSPSSIPTSLRTSRRPSR